MLSQEILDRLFHERDIIGLQFTKGTIPATALFEVRTIEHINLKSYALGSTDGGITGKPALAQNVVGTTWDEILDSAGRRLLEPEHNDVIFQSFYGISPDYIWTYKRYPPNVDRQSLIGSRAVGGRVGAVSGFDSPFRNPSPLTENFTLRGAHFSILGFNPHLEPGATTVYLNFVVCRYGVTFLGHEYHEDKRPTEEQVIKAGIRTVGGDPPTPMPEWLR